MNRFPTVISSGWFSASGSFSGCSIGDSSCSCFGSCSGSFCSGSSVGFSSGCSSGFGAGVSFSSASGSGSFIDEAGPSGFCTSSASAAIGSIDRHSARQSSQLITRFFIDVSFYPLIKRPSGDSYISFGTSHSFCAAVLASLRRLTQSFREM